MGQGKAAKGKEKAKGKKYLNQYTYMTQRKNFSFAAIAIETGGSMGALGVAHLGLLP